MEAKSGTDIPGWVSSPAKYRAPSAQPGNLNMKENKVEALEKKKMGFEVGQLNKKNLNLAGQRYEHSFSMKQCKITG